MTAAAIEDLFGQFKNCKVLVVGDVMLDSYLWGSTNRISPEAPVPIVSVDKREIRLGGAANVALNLSAMGATPVLCTVIGDDIEGKDFFNLLEEHNLTKEGCVVSTQRKTTIKHRIIASAQHLLRVDTEDDFDLLSAEEKSLAEKFDQLIDQVDVVLFQDYNKGVLTKRNIPSFIQKAKEKGIPIIVDPKKKNFTAYKEVSVFKPNLKELSEGLKVDIPRQDQEAIIKAVKTLKEKLGMENALVTLSEEGVYIGDGELNFFNPAHKRKIADVSGAGDTVVSIAALCLACNTSIEFLSQLSNLSGGLVCEHVGVVPINNETLKNEALNKLSV